MSDQQKYRTICADPPWRYRKDGEKRVGIAGKDRVLRRAEQHYQTMANREILQMPIREVVDDSAHLYLWTTAPRLYGERNDRSISPADIVEAWGFEYVTTLVWIKQGSPGMGNYWRIDTEFVLFGVRGRCPVPPSIRTSNIITARKTGHSVKPEAFYTMVERVSPGPRLDVFSRKRRDGWDSWGNEVPEYVQAALWLPDARTAA